MKKIILKFLGVIFIVNLLLVSCTSKFEDINTDPNASIPDVPSTSMLAFNIRYYLNNMYDAWNDMNEPETYGGHLAKIQYIDEARYVYRPGTVENKWYYAYRTLYNIRKMQAVAIIEKNSNMQAVGKVLEAFIMQEVTDTWRDVPYSDAFKLDQGVTNPKYDTQEIIYPALIALLQDASVLFQKNEGVLGDGDVLFHGDIQKWQKFSNSLILRLSIRISKVAPAVARPIFEKILGDPSKYPILESNDDNVFFYWPGSSPYYEPWYNDFLSRDDHGVSDVLINTLTGLNDPRLPIYAYPATADDIYRGFKIGAKAQPSLSAISRIGSRFRQDPKGFSPMMRSSEVWFFIAEASKLGWNTGTATKTAYEKAVTLSLQENGVSTTNIADYLGGNGKFDDTYNQIYLQEWIALFKQGMETWTLYRRTGVPVLYHAPGSKYTGHNVPPFRYPYPATETNLNGTNSATYVGKVKDDFWGQQMWFDTRTGVQ